MKNLDEKLKRWQSIATIVSAMAIPLVLALGSYFVQKKIADDGIRKDYVAIASSILSGDSASQDPELRNWAVKVLTRYSPVAFSDEAKQSLEEGIFIFPQIPSLPQVVRQGVLDPKCDPSCTSIVGGSVDAWQLALSRSSSIGVLEDVLNEVIQRAVYYAGVADEERIRGAACVDIYENIREVLKQ